MTRSKVLPILLVVGLLSLLIPLTIALAQGGGGTVTIRDSDDTNYSELLSNMAMITFTDVPAPPKGKAYEGWFVSDDGTRKESTGFLNVENGMIDETFWLTEDKFGENLFGEFNAFVVTIEDSDAPHAAPAGEKAFAHTISAGALAHIRHLLYSWKENPVYAKGFYKGKDLPKGITVGLREQTRDAQKHAGFSAGSTGIDAVHVHACYVVNIIEGKGGANYDADCGYDGDGFGVLNYADYSASHAGFAAGADEAKDSNVTIHSQEVINWSMQVKAMAEQARDLAKTAKGIDDLAAARLTIGQAEAILGDALETAKQAYWAAQNMGTFTPVSVEAAAAETAKLPSTGDSTVPNIALASLLVGAFLLLGGAYIYRRSRTRA